MVNAHVLAHLKSHTPTRERSEGESPAKSLRSENGGNPEADNGYMVAGG